MQNHVRTVTVVLFVCVGVLISRPLGAQNVSVLRSTPPKPAAAAPGQRDETPARPATEVAVPVAASSDLGGEEQKGVAPTVGFQVFQKDRFFIGAFFTLAATDPSVTEEYGAFVVNPPLKGRSFYVSGNRTWPLSLFSKKKKDSFLLAGVGARWGATSANFEFTPMGTTTAQKRNGFATVAAVTAQLVTRSLPVTMGEEKGEFQLGVEVGPTWRLLGGDLSQDDAFRRQVLGTDKSSFAGYEFTFFARVNSVQPFARFSSFSRPGGTVINGLTGRQLVWGVNVASSLFQSKVDD